LLGALRKVLAMPSINACPDANERLGEIIQELRPQRDSNPRAPRSATPWVVCP
jgi:hypothetical protein